MEWAVFSQEGEAGQKTLRREVWAYEKKSWNTVFFRMANLVSSPRNLRCAPRAEEEWPSSVSTIFSRSLQ